MEGNGRQDMDIGRDKSLPPYCLLCKGLGVYCLMHDTWSSQGYSVSCMTTFSLSLQSPDQTSEYVKWAISLVIAYSPWCSPQRFVWACRDEQYSLYHAHCMAGHQFDQ